MIFRVHDIRERLGPFPQLKEKLRELRDANARHGQYAAAMENLKHIFNLQTTLQEIRDALDDEKSGGNLLLAHKHIMDLERARDELLAEVHKMSGTNTEKEQMVICFFFCIFQIFIILFFSFSSISSRELTRLSPNCRRICGLFSVELWKWLR